jgi:hypothetical protein
MEKLVALILVVVIVAFAAVYALAASPVQAKMTGTHCGVQYCLRPPVAAGCRRPT